MALCGLAWAACKAPGPPLLRFAAGPGPPLGVGDPRWAAGEGDLLLAWAWESAGASLLLLGWGGAIRRFMAITLAELWLRGRRAGSMGRLAWGWGSERWLGVPGLCRAAGPSVAGCRCCALRPEPLNLVSLVLWACAGSQLA